MPAGATEGCKANPRIAIFDEMGGSGAGRCEGRHNALVSESTDTFSSPRSMSPM